MKKNAAINLQNVSESDPENARKLNVRNRFSRFFLGFAIRRKVFCAFFRFGMSRFDRGGDTQKRMILHFFCISGRDGHYLSYG